MSNQTKPKPRKINETEVDKIYDDCHKVKQHLDMQRYVSYTVLYNPETEIYFGLVYYEREDQYYKITSEEQYWNGKRQNVDSAFPYWLNFKENRAKSRSLIFLQDIYEGSDIDPDEVTGKNPFEDFALRTPGDLGGLSEEVLAKTKFLKNHL